MKVLCVVPARGGSKRLPGKNLEPVGGISLTGRAVRQALQFARLARIQATVVVDTDDEAIASEGRAWGADVPFLRELSLAADDTSSATSTIALLARLARQGRAFDVVALLQPTSPLRTTEDIAACWQALAVGAPSVASVAVSGHPAELALRRGTDGILTWAWPMAREPWIGNRFPDSVRLTGAVYFVTSEFLRSRGAFVVPGVTVGVICPPGRSIDVDTVDDLALARAATVHQAPRALEIAGRQVGAPHRCLVIAEAGVNHNGDVALAHRLVDVAADGSADAVKFQTFDPELLVAADAPKADYQMARSDANESQRDMLRRLALSRTNTAALARHAGERGILFLSTPFDEPSADFLAELGVPAFKVPSGEITNAGFLRHIGRLGRPVMMSTGMSTLSEVAAAVDVLADAGQSQYALLHCVSEYPASLASANLEAMATLRTAFGVPVGWSDHTQGTTASLAAVAMGAAIVEKHFTLDRQLPGPDHAASLEPAELRALVADLRAIESARGTGRKLPTPGEQSVAAVARRSLHAARDLPAGHRLAAHDVAALRPGTGISPMRLDALIGRALRHNLAAGAMLNESDLG